MDRRRFLQGALSAAALPLAPKLPAGPPAGTPKKPFRFAFLTDSHHKNPSTLAAIGRCVAQLKKEAPEVRLLVHGGDLLDRAEIQAGEASLPQYAELLPFFRGYDFHAAIGNHDLAALKMPDDPLRGKAAFLKAVGPTYSRFQAGGLTFIILDSLEVIRDTFSGTVPADTMAWLKAQLGTLKKTDPIVLVSHVPLFTIMGEYSLGTMVPPVSRLIVSNAKAVYDLVREHRVVACLQGHTHVEETCDDARTKWITGGAVCGDWWKGARFGRYAPGFCLCTWDGERFDWTYHTYDWQPVVND